MSVPSNSSSKNKSEDDGSWNLVHRRREKTQRRRSVGVGMTTTTTTAATTNLKPTPTILDDDPYTVLALAVRYDESMNDAESILQIPLESGGIYNPKRFIKALDQLYKKTTAPLTTTPQSQSQQQQPQHLVETKSNPDNDNDNISNTIVVTAMTPIILSGLLANLHDDSNNNSNSTSTINSTELVSYCQQMRRAALMRVRLRKKTRKFQKILMPILLLSVAITFYFYIMSNLRTVLLEYGFAEYDDDSNNSCHHYEHACRQAEAYTWEKLNEVQPYYYQFKDNMECTVSRCPLVHYFNTEKLPPFYTMHTILEENIIPLEDVVTTNNNQYHSRRKRRRVQLQQPHRHSSIDSTGVHEGDESDPLRVQWLGDTLTNRLVRETIKETGEQLLKQKKYGGETFSICDVGAGLGGTLFSLLVKDLPFQQQWSYHGISLSLPEVRRAKQLMKIHKISPKVVNVTFQQGSFDNPLPPKAYNAMIAIESLAYSHNITKTLINLSSAMKPKGTLIVVEDVVAPWAKGSREMEEVINATAKYSLLTHQEWLETLTLTGFNCDNHQQQPPRDLSLEFDWVPNLDYESPTYESAITSHVNNVLNRFLSWFGRVGRNKSNIGSSSSMKATAVRAIHLFEDLVLFSRARTIRHAAHARGDLQYMFYVCSK